MQELTAWTLRELEGNSHPSSFSVIAVFICAVFLAIHPFFRRPMAGLARVVNQILLLLGVANTMCRTLPGAGRGGEQGTYYRALRAGRETLDKDESHLMGPGCRFFLLCLNRSKKIPLAENVQRAHADDRPPLSPLDICLAQLASSANGGLTFERRPLAITRPQRNTPGNCTCAPASRCRR